MHECLGKSPRKLSNQIDHSRYLIRCAVPIFNLCTKCVGSSVIIYNCIPDYQFPGMGAWMTSLLNVALNRMLRKAIEVLVFILTFSMGACTTRDLQSSCL